MKDEEMYKKIYSQYDIDMQVIAALQEQDLKHHAIIEYLLNKHSKSIKEGGLDYKKAFEEFEDYEEYLSR